MMSYFDACVEIVMAEEVGIEQYKKGSSGYVYDPFDPGGETKWGISKRYNPEVDIKNLTKEEAKAIYKQKYWDIFNGDKIKSYGLALLLFDSTVNPGSGRSLKWMQKSLNYFKVDEKLEVDGIFGQKSVSALNSLAYVGYEKVLACLFVSMRGTWHMSQVEDDPEKYRYFVGWIKRLGRITYEALG